MREKIIAGNIYHALNRGVDQRKIFLDDEDRFRFIHNLFEFNNLEPINNIGYFFNQNQYKAFATPYIERKPRKLLVEVLAFCLMSNHYHLMLKPLYDNGILKFIKRLNMGYAMYFNQKYKRSGALFQGRYKTVHVSNEAHFIHLPYYIHLNPLDLAMPEWRNRKLKNYNKATEFLNNYRWSSHLDYLGKENFPSVTQRNFLLDFFDGTTGYKNKINAWLKELDPESIKEILLEPI